jgi:hypothetical protein
MRSQITKASTTTHQSLTSPSHIRFSSRRALRARCQLAWSMFILQHKNQTHRKKNLQQTAPLPSCRCKNTKAAPVKCCTPKLHHKRVTDLGFRPATPRSHRAVSDMPARRCSLGCRLHNNHMTMQFMCDANRDRVKDKCSATAVETQHCVVTEPNTPSDGHTTCAQTHPRKRSRGAAHSGSSCSRE